MPKCRGQTTAPEMLTDGRTERRTEWGIAIALSQIGWLGAKNILGLLVRSASVKLSLKANIC